MIRTTFRAGKASHSFHKFLLSLNHFLKSTEVSCYTAQFMHLVYQCPDNYSKIVPSENMSSESQVAGFAAFNRGLMLELRKIAAADKYEINDPKVFSFLNGQASIDLRNTVPVDILRNHGIFFTPSDLASKTVSSISDKIKNGFSFIDPTCGAGNLLICCANNLPITSSLLGTIEAWSNRIQGRDIFEELVDATRLRLLLLAVIRTQDTTGLMELIGNQTIFPGLIVGDLFDGTVVFGGERSVFVLNPPFGKVLAPDGCTWASGIVQTAGIHFERTLNLSRNGQEIVAILPDVLRSGSRYKKWRDLVAIKCNILSITSMGRFDSETDVDVFILHCATTHQLNPNSKWPIETIASSSENHVSDFYEVKIGTIVPHRDLPNGKIHPYLHAKTATPWKTIEKLDETISTNHTVFDSPFVTIHRTSSPADRHRCVATVIKGVDNVAVENHLIVVHPKDGSLEMCKRLLRKLRSKKVDSWMNHRIRCRHLTAASIKEIPW